MNIITESEARAQLVLVIKEAIATLPTTYRGPHAKEYIEQSLEQFAADSGILGSLYLEFGSSFHVTGHLSVSKNTCSFEVTVSYASGMKTLAQTQAMYNLIGDLLKVAHTIQAAIDSLPTIDRKKK